MEIALINFVPKRLLATWAFLTLCFDLLIMKLKVNTEHIPAKQSIR